MNAHKYRLPFLSYLAVSGLWVLHWLPLRVLRALGWLLGHCLMYLGRHRRQIGLTNLQLCFPHLTETQRTQLLRQHFIAFAQSFLDRTLFWWASAQRIRRIVRLNGETHLSDPSGRPTIVLAPHFLGLDAAGSRLSMLGQWVSVYSRQKNPVFDRLLYHGRTRFNAQILLSRQEGLRKAIRAMTKGHPFYYLPDMDFGPEDSIFVPFFGIPAATVPGVTRLAKITKARVVPCITRMVRDGYEVTLYPAWENFPSVDPAADTLRINQYIESIILTMPAQYHWLHKRFKTRPPGSNRVYQAEP